MSTGERSTIESTAAECPSARDLSDPGWPQRLGAYQVQRLLGRGGMGEVYLAWDERLERHVAIKRLRPERVTDAQRERFRREARATAQLQHPSVVQVYDILELDDSDCIVMEYVPGRTVAQLVRHGALALPLALRLARQVAEGLQAAHARGLVHRDLKAENVILTESLDAKILDFGLVTTHAPQLGETTLTEPGMVLGTASAMAPEQARGEATDARSDLFALGVLLYRMLSGVAPFAGTDSNDSLRRLQEESAVPITERRSEVPQALAHLIERLLAKNPDRRPRSAQEVVETLTSLSGGAVVPQADTGGSTSTLLLPPARRRLQAKRRRRVGGWIVALTVLLLGLGAWWWWRSTAPPPPPLRVLVLNPEVTARSGETSAALDAVASAVLSASLSSLGNLQGVQALDPSLALATESPLLQAQAVAADELLYAAIAADKYGSGGRVSLRRLDGETGAVLWTESFSVPVESPQLQLTAESVAVALSRAWPAHEPRPGVPELAVRAEDYAEFVQLWTDFKSDRLVEVEQLERVEQLLSDSPRFFSGYLLAVEMHLQRFASSRRRVHLERAEELLAGAAEVAPDDPRLLTLRFFLQRLDGRLDDAAETLEQLRSLTPADVNLLAMEADLASQRGDSEAARRLLLEAVERAPVWELRYRLATLAGEAGDLDTARQQLGHILERYPENPRAAAQLAVLELRYGDLARAVDLYESLAEASPRRSLWTNLGLAQYLLGRYPSAIASYQRALEIDPDHPIVLLNLADAQAALGQQEESRSTCERLLERLDASTEDGQGALSADILMVRAQCLAQLGQVQEALEIVQTTRRQDVDNADLAYQAAVVYAIAGERASALLAARQASEQGLQPRWLRVPAFDLLVDDPGFQQLLAADEPPG